MADEHINVSVRLRPLHDDEKHLHDRIVLKKQPDGALLFTESEDVARSIPYSQVFDEHASSQEVFDGVVAMLLDQALLGKNATVFAYGQTGSGKTYTVDGLMSSSAEFLFSSIVNTPDREFLLKLSAVEVYNETVHDLLARGDCNTRLDLVENREGKTVVKNVVEESLLSAMHLQRLLRRVKENRKVLQPYLSISMPCCLGTVLNDVAKVLG
jgi:centromeric protein E